MALKKELVFENGVKINHHVIDDIQIDNKNKIAKLKVISYTDKSFRDKEIENKTNKDRYEELLEFITQENFKDENERNVQQVIEWSNEANGLVDRFKEDINLKVATTEIELKDVIDFNMSNLYDLLKQDGLFKDSEDI